MVKKLFFNLMFILPILLSTVMVKAQTKHTVLVGDNFFNPSQFTANVGDTIRWTFIAGSMENHTTTSGSIPTGAASWDKNVNTANPTFQYVITKPGTYNYVCTPHASFGMIGNFTATVTTAIANTELSEARFVSPNPAKDKINFSINEKPTNINLIDLQGRVIKAWHIEVKDSALDISGVPQGMYIILIETNKLIYKQKLFIEQ